MTVIPGRIKSQGSLVNNIYVVLIYVHYHVATNTLQIVFISFNPFNKSIRQVLLLFLLQKLI